MCKDTIFYLHFKELFVKLNTIMDHKSIIKLLENEYANKNILVIGYPATGKTTFAKKYIEYLPQHTLIHTDNYISHGYEQSLYVLIDDLENITTPTFIEGILGYRLLRKGVEIGCYYPDVVFELTASWAHIEKVYHTEREGKKISNLKSFSKSLDSILTEYKALHNPNLPIWHTINVIENINL